MRFMIIVKESPESEAGKISSAAEFEAMGKFNEALIDAGIVLAMEGLMPSKEGARITFRKDGQREVKDGPFAEAKELVGGFWIIQVKSKDEAMAWINKIPFRNGETVELRRVAESADFEGAAPPEMLAKEDEFRDRTQKPITN